jgi:hypothetical protein
VGYCESLEAAREAAAEVLSRGWDLGVHWPLVTAEPQRHRWFDPDPAVRERALEETGRACGLAADLGASYILFHFPWPVLLEEGLDYHALAWAEVCLDCLELARRWYPLTTHLHLHAASSKRRVNHVPVLPSQSPDEGWAPSVEMARELLARPPGPDTSGRGLRIALEHDPGKVTPGELEECHRWVRGLARTLPPPGAGRR